MKQQQFVLKKNEGDEIPGEFIITHKGITYPLSRKSNVHAFERFGEITDAITLNSNEITLRTRLKRARVGDSCHVRKVPLKSLGKVFDVCDKLSGKIVGVNHDKVSVELNTIGCEGTVMDLYRNDVILTSIANEHEVAYFSCPSCGMYL